VSSYKAVLVGTDGSESSFRAVDRAASVAADADATLFLLTAYRPMSLKEREDALSSLGDEAYKVQGATPAEDVLRDAEDRAVKLGVKKVKRLAIEGDPVDALVKGALDNGVDLLVVGNRGLNSLAGRLLGSVPANITHKANCDVLIVHTTGKGTPKS
jgi:nucleotide-binding universal stress UspA family protein